MGIFIKNYLPQNKRGVAFSSDKGGEMATESKATCENCPLRARYDRNPKSILSRIWKWHTSWCPGWKSYLNSLPDEERAKIIEKYK